MFDDDGSADLAMKRIYMVESGLVTVYPAKEVSQSNKVYVIKRAKYIR
jgi:hypothetical protein